MKKKFLFAGIALILVMVCLGTCESVSTDEGEIEYTDVVYSKDGSQVTVYLDGVGVPTTKAERAMTRDLAMMSYDFLEVIFQTATGISRSSWELGQPAGISGSGLRIAGSNYNNFTGTLSNAATGLQYACLFVGTSSNKTLLGVGKLTGSTLKSTGLAATTNVSAITDDTQSVTFSVVALQTGLLIGTETASGTFAARGIPVKSFDFAASGTNPTGYTTGYVVADFADHSARQTLPDGISYPTYSLPKTAKTVTNATYTFQFVTGVATSPVALEDVTTSGGYLNAIKNFGVDKPPVVQKRTPRFMDGGRYLEAKGHVDTKTTVKFRDTYLPNFTTPTSHLPAADSNFDNIVPLVFTTETGSGGIFSFYLEIPVYMLNKTTPATLNGTTGFTTWYIRTGLGSELYSLDDGASSGGCVFMSSGVSASDWLDILVDWVK